MNKVPYIDLVAQYAGIRNEITEALDRVFSSGGFILGDEVAAFEAAFASRCGTRYAVGVGNGTDAIILTLHALGIGPGDEVITAPNSFIASASAIALTGATPVFVDVGEDYNINASLLESAITVKTRAILPVHLTGRPADMESILAVAGKYHLAVVEDAAQAVSAVYRGQRVGCFGIAGCFSLHPLKNLSASGDAGIITTNDESIYRRLISARNHGLRNRDESGFWSANSRLDAIQAAILRVKLNYLDAWTAARRSNAAYYCERLGELLRVPSEKPHEFSVFHTFVVQSERRDRLREHLSFRGIETKIHYPVPIHLQEAARSLGYKYGAFPVAEMQALQILSLPVFPELRTEQREHIANSVIQFYEL